MLVVITYGAMESPLSDGHGLKAQGQRIEDQTGALVLIRSYKDDLARTVRQYRTTDPTVLIGHSWGGGKSVEAAAELEGEGVAIDHLILLDPVPHRLLWGFLNFRDFVLPANVRKASCFLRDPLAPAEGRPVTKGPFGTPFSLPIRAAACPYTNTGLPLGHSSFNGDPGVDQFMLAAAKALMPASPAEALADGHEGAVLDNEKEVA